jgi:hypothetical protein
MKSNKFLDYVEDKLKEVDPPKVVGDLLKEYKYQPELTVQLDNLDLITREEFYRIALWKVDRFPSVSDDILHSINGLKKLTPGDHRESSSYKTLECLLQCKGIQLPMASTLFRFANPEVFQIIDKRAYRALYLGLEGQERNSYPNKHFKPSEESMLKWVRESIEIYFQYLDDLRRIDCKKIPFRHADRILYQLDIVTGGRVKR